MQQDLTNISFLFPQSAEIDNVRELQPDEIFSDLSVSFLNAVSSSLMRDHLVRKYSDVSTFAFFCRKANILSYKKKYESYAIRLGRGVVFHIAPSNVPVNFAYSMAAGILSGNINIVRVPSDRFEQIDLICQTLEDVTKLPEYNIFKKRLFLVRYDRNSNVTECLSSLCDIRVIWGGDDTIAQIRKSVLPPRSTDITFADRYSLAVINADAIIFETNLDKLAEGFYNDTYLFDQNACSSPRLVIWTGNKENISTGKNMFWKAVQTRLGRYELSSILSMDKLSALYWHSTQNDGVRLVPPENNKLWRIHIDSLSSDIDKFRCAGGYFLEYDAAALDELSGIVSRKYQTLAYYGYSEKMLSDFVRLNRMNGIDRIVPIGKTTDFNLIWDGYDMIRSLSRECLVE